MAEEKNTSEIQVNLGEIFSFIWRKFWIVVLSLILGAGIGFAVTEVTRKDIYSTKAIYVVYYDGGGELIDEAANQSRIASVLVNCVITVQQNRFAKAVAEKMNESEEYEISAGEILGSVTYAYTATTTAGYSITITAQSASREKAYDTMIAITDIFSDYVRENFGLAVDASLIFSLVNDIEMPTSPITDSSVIKNAVIGALAAVAVCIIVLALIVIFDQRVKGEDDLVNRYEIAVLGSVPNFEDKDLTKGGNY